MEWLPPDPPFICGKYLAYFDSEFAYSLYSDIPVFWKAEPLVTLRPPDLRTGEFAFNDEGFTLLILPVTAACYLGSLYLYEFALLKRTLSLSD